MKNYIICKNNFVTVQISEKNIGEILSTLRLCDCEKITYTITTTEKINTVINTINFENFNIDTKEKFDYGLKLTFIFQGRTLKGKESNFLTYFKSSGGVEHFKIFETLDEVMNYYEKYFGSIEIPNNMHEIFHNKIDYIEWDLTVHNELENCANYNELSFGMDKDSLKERAVKGMSWADWINFDYWFSTVILRMAIKLKTEGHTHPYMTGNANDEMIWHQKLDKIIDAFSLYLDDDKDYTVIRTKLDEAFDIIKENFYFFND